MKTDEYGFSKQHSSKDEKILWKATAKKKLRFGFADIATLASPTIILQQFRLLRKKINIQRKYQRKR